MLGRDPSGRAMPGFMPRGKTVPARADRKLGDQPLSDVQNLVAWIDRL